MASVAELRAALGIMAAHGETAHMSGGALRSSAEATVGLIQQALANLKDSDLSAITGVSIAKDSIDVISEHVATTMDGAPEASQEIAGLCMSANEVLDQIHSQFLQVIDSLEGAIDALHTAAVQSDDVVGYASAIIERADSAAAALPA